jgi:hypothetical protein
LLPQYRHYRESTTFSNNAITLTVRSDFADDQGYALMKEEGLRMGNPLYELGKWKRFLISQCPPHRNYQPRDFVGDTFFDSQCEVSNNLIAIRIN